MKHLLTAIGFSFCFAVMATTQAISEKSSPTIEATTSIDGKKKNRRTKRVKAKRKRRCQKAARRNFAG